ncbi:MAG: hypothetical protein AAGG51_14220 [Cyanobacteria bacterium P01_G01_bin.54]
MTETNSPDEQSSNLAPESQSSSESWFKRLFSRLTKIQGKRFFGFGFIFVFTLFAISVVWPEPTPVQHQVFRVMLALSAMSIIASLPTYMGFRTPLEVRATGAILAFILVYSFSPTFIGSEISVPSEAVQSLWEAEVLNIREDLSDVEVKWERLDEGEIACQLISNNSKKIGSLLAEIEDEKFGNNIHTKIEKYRSAQYSYIMASDVECDESTAKEYAKTSLDYGDLALQNIESAKEEPGEYGESLRKWLKEDFTEERIYFHKALGNALLYRLGVEGEADEVQNSLKQISRKEFYKSSGINLERNRFLSPISNLDSPNLKDPIFSHPCRKTCGISYFNLDLRLSGLVANPS